LLTVIDVLAFFVFVSFEVFAFDQGLDALLDGVGLGLEHGHLLHHVFHEVVVLVGLSGLHDSDNGCVDHHGSLLVDFRVNVFA